MIATFLFLILAFNLTSNIYLVSGEEGGTGKYLQINFTTPNFEDTDDLLLSNTEVTALKIGSDQLFRFEADTASTHSQKVGAGTVLLTALPDTDNGWEFCYFRIRGEESADLSYYKTEKYDIIDAVFKREVLTSDITISVTSGLGAVKYQGEIIASQTNTPVTITVDYGTIPRFEFVPDDLYHLSSVLVDDSFYVDLILTEFTQNYEYPIITEPIHSLDVAFSQDGTAVIPPGTDITVFLSSAASLKFNFVNGGTAYGSEIYSLIDVVLWNIDVDFDTLGDQTIVALRYDPTLVIGAEEDLRLYRSNSEFAELYYQCDFNDDGVVDGQDVKIIANIVKHPKFWDPTKNPEYDLDGDDAITEEDLHIVNSMKNLDLNWEDITLEVDTENNIIYGVTDHFSIFRGR